MAIVGKTYGNGRLNLHTGVASLANTLKFALFTSSYTPAADTDTTYSGLSNECTGTNYTAGGKTVGSVSNTLVVANSWTGAWAASTAYALGQIVKPLASPNGFLFRACTAGSSGSSEPTWPTVTGETVVDSGVTWTCIGTSGVICTGTIASWTTVTLTNVRYGVLYDSTSGKLISYYDFGTTQTISGGTFTVTVDSVSGLYNSFGE